MRLDVDTLQFATLAARSSYLVVFIVAGLRQRGETYLWHWVGSILISTLGSVFLFRTPGGDTLPTFAALPIYGAVGTSLALSWSGLRHFYGRSAGLLPIVVLSVLPAASYSVVIAIGMMPRFAFAAVFASCMVSTGLTVRECVRRSAGDRLWSQYIIAAAMSGYFLVFLISIAIIIGTDLPMNPDESGRMSLAVDQVAGILIHFGYLAMAGERASLRLSRLAETDDLTGLANRRGLAERLRRDGRSCEARMSAGVLIADIDHFKSINDRHGHKSGDEVLIAFSRRLSAIVRGQDLAVRWGGEEFLAVLPGIGIEQAAIIAERLRAATEAEPFAIPGAGIAVTVSIGIAVTEPGEAGIEPATLRADAALYAAKTGGRNRVCRADPAQDALRAGPEPRAAPAASPGLVPTAS